MTQDAYYIITDAGNTNMRVQLRDRDGTILIPRPDLSNDDTLISQPGFNPTYDMDRCMVRLGTVIDGIIAAHHLAEHNLIVGIGSAGITQVHENVENYIRHRYPNIHGVFCATDADAACTGAHNAQYGGHVIVGTGVAAFVRKDGIGHRAGGGGKATRDPGSGYWMGCEAIAMSHDPIKRQQSSFLQHIYAQRVDLDAANMDAVAALAKDVIQAAQHNDPNAISILEQGGKHVADLINWAVDTYDVPVTLSGGVAEYIRPYIPEQARNHIRDPKGNPFDGILAIAMGKVKAAWLKTSEFQPSVTITVPRPSQTAGSHPKAHP